MKKILFLFCIFPIFASYCYSQKTDTIYFDKKANISTKKKCKLYIIAKQDTNITRIAAYSKNGVLISTGGFKSVDFKNMKGEETGPFNYFKNGRLEKFALYEPSKYPEILSSLSKFLEKIPQQPDSLHLEVYYHENGEIDCVGYRGNGCDLVGTWVFYTEDGKFTTVESYKNNLIDGPATVYYLDKVTETRNYKDGKRTGAWDFYYTDGGIYRTDFYLDGKKIKVIRQSNN
jgi:antitoxin component YwqK of YwqJK toxin-antitoxin module